MSQKKKRIKANFYAKSVNSYERIPKEEKEKLKEDKFWGDRDYWYVEHELPDNCLYSGWGKQYPTKITPDDLPENYIFLSNYKKRGYIRTAGVSDLCYRPSYFHNHTYKDDFIYIAYDGKKLPEYKPCDYSEDSVLMKCDEYIFGMDIVDFIFAVEKYSPEYDVSDIKSRMVDQYNAYVDEMQEEPHVHFYKNLKKIKKLEELIDRRAGSSDE